MAYCKISQNVPLQQKFYFLKIVLNQYCALKHFNPPEMSKTLDNNKLSIHFLHNEIGNILTHIKCLFKYKIFYFSNSIVIIIIQICNELSVEMILNYKFICA